MAVVYGLYDWSWSMNKFLISDHGAFKFSIYEMYWTKMYIWRVLMSIHSLVLPSTFLAYLVILVPLGFRQLKLSLTFQPLSWHYSCICSVLRYMVFRPDMYLNQKLANHFFLILFMMDFVYWSGCKWLWFRTCGIWIFHASLHFIWRRNFSKLVDIWVLMPCYGVSLTYMTITHGNC